MAATAALPDLLRPPFPPALPPSLERRRPVLLLQPSAFIRWDSLSCYARNAKATSDRGGGFIPGAYVTGTAYDEIFGEVSTLGTPEKEEEVIGWGLLWSLLWRHRLRLGVALVALIGCTTCTLSMPLFSGKFFEVLVCLNSEPLWRLLGKIGILLTVGAAIDLLKMEPVLFLVSVGKNIAYGLPDDDMSKEDIIKAAKAANGYDMLVVERGGLLSGGRRQRVAIARALLKNAPILILDEATSALDTVNERLVQEPLDHLMKGSTTLVIAHRLSTVQNAHQIALCSEGRIAELGMHSELLSRKAGASDLALQTMYKSPNAPQTLL